MAFNLMDTFEYKGKKPNFSRDQFKTIEEMVTYPEYYLPDTFIATCVEDGNGYIFNRSNPIKAELGKWRKIAGRTGEIDEESIISIQDIADLFV